MEEERPQEGGERTMLEMDSEEDPQHKVRAMEALEMGEQESTSTAKRRKIHPSGSSQAGCPQDMSHQTLLSQPSHPRHHQPRGQSRVGSPREALEGAASPRVHCLNVCMLETT